ncbi:MAG: NifU family protein [Flavobacteriales bacterium]|nr:NifU family protein [Flavobacteriales bacterium]
METSSPTGIRTLARTKERINQALTEIRPFLEADGGDISLEEVTKDGVVRVRLHGACSTCSMVAMTMKAGVEEAIKRAAPEVVKVEAVV